MPGLAAYAHVGARELLALVCYAVHNYSRELCTRLLPRLSTYDEGRWVEFFIIAEQVVRERTFATYSRESELPGMRLPQLPGLAGVMLIPYSRILNHVSDALWDQRLLLAEIVGAARGDARAAAVMEAILLVEQGIEGAECWEGKPEESGQARLAWKTRTAAMEQLTFAY